MMTTLATNKVTRAQMNDQPRMAEAHRRQLNRLRSLLSGIPRRTESDSPSPTAPISTHAFGGFLMLARTEEQVGAFILANPEAAARFARKASSFGGFEAGHPPNTMHAANEASLPFFSLGWVEGGDPLSLNTPHTT